MDAARMKRYGDKLSLIARRREQVSEWLGSFSQREMTMLACYKAFQEMAEAAMDIVSMIVRDEGEVPKDDYMNVSLLVQKGIVGKKLADALRQANGLRNRLVHEYNGLNNERAHDSMAELLGCFDDFHALVVAWLKKK